MPHSLILGMTESGKTTKAVRLCNKYRENNIGTIVLDPLCDPRWNASFITADPEEYLQVVFSSRSCGLFIDESGDCIGRYDKAMNRLATMSRHFGHNAHFMTQRGCQISRTIRDMCTYLYLFTTALKDSEQHAIEWNKPQLKGASQLRRGEYFYCNKYEIFQKCKLF